MKKDTNNSNDCNSINIQCHACGNVVPIELIHEVAVVRKRSGGLGVAIPSLELENHPDVEEILMPSLVCFQCFAGYFENKIF